MPVRETAGTARTRDEGDVVAGEGGDSSTADPASDETEAGDENGEADCRGRGEEGTITVTEGKGVRLSSGRQGEWHRVRTEEGHHLPDDTSGQRVTLRGCSSADGCHLRHQGRVYCISTNPHDGEGDERCATHGVGRYGEY